MRTASRTSTPIEIIAPISSARLKSPAALDDIAAHYELRVVRSDPVETLYRVVTTVSNPAGIEAAASVMGKTLEADCTDWVYIGVSPRHDDNTVFVQSAS